MVNCEGCNRSKAYSTNEILIKTQPQNPNENHAKLFTFHFKLQTAKMKFAPIVLVDSSILSLASLWPRVQYTIIHGNERTQIFFRKCLLFTLDF